MKRFHEENVHCVALVELDDQIIWHIFSFHVDNPFFLLTVSQTWKGARHLIAIHMKAKVQVVSTPITSDHSLRAICITRLNHESRARPSLVPARPSRVPARPSLVSISRYFHPFSDWDAELWFLLKKLYVFHFKITPGAQWLFPISPAILLNQYRSIVTRALAHCYPHGFKVLIKLQNRPSIHMHVRNMFLPNESKLMRAEPTTGTALSGTTVHYEHFMVPKTQIHNDVELWSMDPDFPSFYTWIDNPAAFVQLNNIITGTDKIDMAYPIDSMPRRTICMVSL